MADTATTIDFTPTKKDVIGRVAVWKNGSLLHGDEINISLLKDRKRFAAQMAMLYPAIEAEDIEKILMGHLERQLSKGANQTEEQQAIPVKLDNIVRPQLFHTPEVSGLLLPVTRSTGKDGIESQWALHVQYRDGKREIRDLTNSLTVPGGEVIWFHPMPPQATPKPSPWRESSIADWKAGKSPRLDDLFCNLLDIFGNFLVLKKDECIPIQSILALWVMLTYVFPAWKAIPYLSIGGPLGSGKSRCFEILQQLVFQPLPSSNMTAPCLFRSLHSLGGTLLLDEAERLRDKSPDVTETKSILLCGYKQGSHAHRLESDGKNFYPVEFDVFGPKAIAGISGLPPALASRCIRINMFRAEKNSPIPKRRLDEKEESFRQIKDGLHAMALCYGGEFIKAGKSVLHYDQINGRDYEVWHPILSIAKMIEEIGNLGGIAETVYEYAFKMISTFYEDILPETDEIVLVLLAQALQESKFGVTAGQLLERARAEEIGVFGKFTAKGISTILHRYSIHSEKSNGKKLFRPSVDTLLSIQRAYGFDLGIDSGLDDSKPD